jgi:hypothetical protein
MVVASGGRSTHQARPVHQPVGMPRGVLALAEKQEALAALALYCGASNTRARQRGAILSFEGPNCVPDPAP